MDGQMMMDAYVTGLNERWCELSLLRVFLKYGMGQRINVSECAM